MLITLLIFIIMSNAATMEKEKSILYSRVAIQGLIFITYIAYTSLYTKPLEKGIGLYNGLFNVTTFTLSFNMFVIILGSVICILTAFYPRTLEKAISSVKEDNKGLKPYNSNIEKEFILNKTLSQFTIIEYALIIIFVLCGAVLLMGTGDLISLFLSLELQSYGLYILATLYRDSESATESGLTYFLLGGLSSCFILLGSAILYVNSGTTDLDNLYVINSVSDLTVFETFDWGKPYESSYINFSLIILAVGLLFKVSAAPFHFWSPDVYDGIPTIVTTFVAIIAKISLFVLMLELVYHSPGVLDVKWGLIIDDMYLVLEKTTDGYPINYKTDWKNVLLISSLLSLIVGSILGLTQYRIKRLFAYSTISHVGFILLALCVNSIESIQGYIFYILQYSISNLNAFFILITIGYTLYSYEYNTKIGYYGRENKLIDAKNSPIQLLSQLKGYFHINSFLSISLAITLFSFVGIPPLIGFFAKQMVLSAALDKGYVFITLIGVITSVIGAVYYLNIVKLMFFNKSEYTPLKSVNKSTVLNINNAYIYTNSVLSTTVTILTMVILLFIFMPDEWFRIVSILSLSLSSY